MHNAKDNLLEVAFDLFLAQGIDGVGLSEVIKEAGVSKGALYHHFDSKDDLIDQVLQRYFLNGFAQMDFDALAQMSSNAQLAVLTETYKSLFGTEAVMAKYGLSRYFTLFFDSLARNRKFSDEIAAYYQKIQAALQPDAQPFLRQIEGEIYLSTVMRRAADFSFLSASQ